MPGITKSQLAAAHDGLPIDLPMAHAWIKDLRAENERLRAIVDRVPKTADGVFVQDDMPVWYVNAEGQVQQTAIFVMAGYEGQAAVADCYSTYEDAAAAAVQLGLDSGTGGA